jgi:hypothetical protein
MAAAASTTAGAAGAACAAAAAAAVGMAGNAPATAAAAAAVISAAEPQPAAGILGHASCFVSSPGCKPGCTSVWLLTLADCLGNDNEWCSVMVLLQLFMVMHVIHCSCNRFFYDRQYHKYAFNLCRFVWLHLGCDEGQATCLIMICIVCS